MHRASTNSMSTQAWTMPPKELLVGCCPQSTRPKSWKNDSRRFRRVRAVNLSEDVASARGGWHPERTWFELVRRGVRCGQRRTGVRCIFHDGLRNPCMKNASLARQHTRQPVRDDCRLTARIPVSGSLVWRSLLGSQEGQRLSALVPSALGRCFGRVQMRTDYVHNQHVHASVEHGTQT
jgi:hypothetical protein